jgi:hypothetical protein
MSTQNIKFPAGRALMLAALLITGENAMSLEEPNYTVIYNDGNIEYRQYEPYLVSETLIENSADYDDAGNEGFRRLFQYITGDNEGQSKIAMTVPVAQTPNSEKIAMTAPVQQGESGEGWRVAFMLPKEYTLQTAPIPTDERVQIQAMPGRLMAVLRYSGRWTESNFTKKQAVLQDAIDGESIDRIGEFQIALYNPPYTLPFLRRNEVMVEINRAPDAINQISDKQLAAF